VGLIGLPKGSYFSCNVEQMLDKFIIWSVSIAAIIWLLAFIMHVHYRYKEEKIYKKLSTDENNIRKQPIVAVIIEGQLERLRREQKPELEKIERHKQFLRDIMPFIKK
jgi:hypothetical protein